MKWDPQNKQLLTDWCRECPDDHFAPFSPELPHVGCCSYSPVFSLHEIRKMVVSNDHDFFLEKIYGNPDHLIKPYEIIIYAHVNEQFEQVRGNQKLSAMEEEDLKLRFSICQFFISGKGCGLRPEYKNSTCRSFICPAVEERLDRKQQDELHFRVREIRQEAEEFNRKHRSRLQELGLDLMRNMPEVLKYLKETE